MSAHPRTWSEARAAFRARATRAGLTLSEHATGGSAPDGTALVVDVAHTPDQFRRGYVCVSGVHGVEGFAGSTAACAVLDDAAGGRAPWGTDSVLFVHGVNAFGMAWRRRVNGDNIDLNRNFGTLPTPSHPLYPRVRGLLVPSASTSTTPPTLLRVTLRLAAFALRYGIAPTKQALVGGQGDDDDGLFFSGKHRAAEAELVERVLRSHLAAATRVVVVDWHTGLGPRGEDTLLVPPADVSRCARHLGFRVSPLAAADSAAYAVDGGLHGAVAGYVPGAAVDVIAQEFGTVSPQRALFALIAENHVWQRGVRELDHPARAALLDTYDGGADPAWVAAVQAGARRLWGSLPPLLDDPPPQVTPAPLL